MIKFYPRTAASATSNESSKRPAISAFRDAGFFSRILTGLVALVCMLSVNQPVFAQLNTAIDLSTYVRTGRYDLPEPTRTVPPENSLLAQEASGVAYNWDSHTLFLVADGGTSVVEVSKTGALISSMTLARGGSPQGTEFYDPEGVTYIGNGQFVMTEERDRQVVLFTYQAGTTLTRAATKTVKLGTFVPNIGLEGLSFDPLTGGYIFVKEIQPEGLFQTNIDFINGTATNGSATTENSVNLFDPALTGLSDFADVFALSNIPGLSGLPNYGNLLVLSQQDGRIVNISRTGIISSSLTIISDPGNPLSVPDQQHEGMTMDENGVLYIVSENGGGDFDHPQLWVYAPSSVSNQPPTAVALQNAKTTLLENTSTLSRVKVADILVTDDGLGVNTLGITGADAAFFEISGSELFVKAATVLDFETKPVYTITITVNDVAVGGTPDASASYVLTLIDVVNENTPAASVAITEVAPWSSGNSPVAADWFEVTNNSSVPLDITGWKMDDASNSFASSVALNGITTIAPGESVIFLESDSPATIVPLFLNTWFGANVPAGLQVGTYTGGGVGLSTGGDGVSLFDASGLLRAKVAFGSSPAGPYATFNNGSSQENVTITRLSVVNEDGAFAAVNDAAETGSPGSIGKIIISEVSPWSSGNSPVGADWFEITNLRASPVDITGWKMDDNSFSFASSVTMNGITTIAPGESVIFIETATPAATIQQFINTWFGGIAPAGLQIGTYTGSGVGLSTGGDGVAIFNAGGRVQAKVSFGASPAGPSYPTFDNKAGLNDATVSQLSIVGINGAFAAINDAVEIGSPGILGRIFVSEVAPWSSGNSPVGADWFEITNTNLSAVNIAGWKIDDNSGSAAASLALNGITTIKPGESVIFIETATPSTTIPLFISNWFGTSPPAGLQVGSYTGGGVGLSTGGDEVNIYNSFNQLQARVVFGASSSAAPYRTFDNAAGINNTLISQLSTPGINGAFIATGSPDEIGSPGRTVNAACTTLTLTAAQSAVIACNGATTTINVSASGGVAPYTGIGTFTVGAGTFTYTITDARGCIGSTNIVVTQPDILKAVATAPAIGCGATTTTVSVSATGGTAPYTGTGDLNRAAGTWEFAVTDALGCSATTNITIAPGGENACTAKVLLASKTYNPVNYKDDNVRLCAPATYKIPAAIIVTQGNAGNHYAELKYRTPDNLEITLVYRGASSQANPTNLLQVILGRLWIFKGAYLNYNQASPPNQTALRLRAGDNFIATEVTLEVNGSAVYGKTTGGVVLVNYNCRNSKSADGSADEASVPVLTNVQPVVVMTGKGLPEPAPVAGFEVGVLSNPSKSFFTLAISSADAHTPVTVKMMDMNGKVLSTSQTAPNNQVRVGSDRLTAGLYLAEVMQGKQRKVVKLVKVN